MFTRFASYLGLIVVLGFGLSACADAQRAPGHNDSLTTAAESSEVLIEAEREPEAENHAACLVGDWLVSETELQKFYDTVDVADLQIAVTGGMGLAFEEDTYSFHPDFKIVLDISGFEGTGELYGDAFGTYTADDATVTTSAENVDNIEFSIMVMGQKFDGKEMSDSIFAMFAINEAPYECSNDELVIGYQNVDGEPVVPVTFARR